MLTLRFFQAIGGGFSTVICMATVRDIYPVEQLGRRFATVTMVLLIAPLVAPALGAAVLPLGWEMIFVFKAVYAGVLLGAYAGARARDAARPARATCRCARCSGSASTSCGGASTRGACRFAMRRPWRSRRRA